MRTRGGRWGCPARILKALRLAFLSVSMKSCRLAVVARSMDCHRVDGVIVLKLPWKYQPSITERDSAGTAIPRRVALLVRGRMGSLDTLTHVERNATMPTRATAGGGHFWTLRTTVGPLM
ncbi:hypothetical protein F5J12DRAFT_801727 [Pisolithus orientalis]|uniref:uncharacterized protein n=1 Tax=Pisolithus orientalis TaxID=936130 RepID=UPI002224BDCC|nr:uncharacterized protein F5J12DRAFT_801727 [Pisolithus orientalis]KAI6030611.1 hypothetical protein F5J12DRAFT_801727 [Pisolithus orientalis]